MIFVNMFAIEGHTRRACVYLLVGEVEGVVAISDGGGLACGL